MGCGCSKEVSTPTGSPKPIQNEVVVVPSDQLPQNPLVADDHNNDCSATLFGVFSITLPTTSDTSPSSSRPHVPLLFTTTTSTNSMSEIESATSLSNASLSMLQSHAITPTDVPLHRCVQEFGRLKVLNEYSVQHTLGKGTFATVRFGVNTITQECVAIKIPRPPSARQGAPASVVQQLFDDEIDIMKRFRHPNLVSLRTVLRGGSGDVDYLVMEFMAKGKLGSMENYNAVPDPIHVDDVSRIRCQFYDVIQGLKFLHDNRVVHRDIKPENILIHADGTCKVSDFGLSQELPSMQHRFDVMTGTRYFMPPEAWRKSTYNGFAADVWALGVTLYTCVFRCLPYAGNSGTIHHDVILPNVSSLKMWSPMLYDVLQRMMAINERDRVSMYELCNHPFFCDRVPREVQQQQQQRYLQKQKDEKCCST